MRKIVLVSLATNLFAFCIAQAHDCKFKDFLKKDWMAEEMKEEGTSLDDLGILGKSPFYELLNKFKASAKYAECKDEYEHDQRHKEIKEYRNKILKKGSYNSSQHTQVFSHLRYEEMLFFRRKNKSITTTMEFQELYRATGSADTSLASVLECRANNNCSEWQYDSWFKAKRRQGQAIEDFQKTTGAKNPFIDIEDKNLTKTLQEPHQAKHKALKQYMYRTSKNRPYSKNQQHTTYNSLRKEEATLLKIESRSNLDTREFEELKSATWDVDYYTTQVFACDIGQDSYCSDYREKLKKARKRKEFAVKDFEETTGEKNPFTDY